MSSQTFHEPMSGGTETRKISFQSSFDCMLSTDKFWSALPFLM